MTKGDRDKLRAELAGKAMQGIIATGMRSSSFEGYERDIAELSLKFADALMAELGISMEDDK